MAFKESIDGIWRMNLDGGDATELVHNVDSNALPSVSTDGKWVYYSSRDETGNRAFWKVSFDGGQPVKIREKTTCRPSPDGKQFMCTYRDPAPDALQKLQIVSAESGEVVRTLDIPQGTNAFFWSPDGKSLDYTAEREGLTNIWRMPVKGGKEQKLTDWQTPAVIWDLAWSHDGRQLTVTRDTRRAQLILIQNFRPQ
jgi:Tol biopolymer transport system component